MENLGAQYARGSLNHTLFGDKCRARILQICCEDNHVPRAAQDPGDVEL